MTENNWTFDGVVQKFKAQRGTENGQEASWGSMWILIQMNPLLAEVNGSSYRIDQNELFININLNYTESATQRLLSLEIGNKILVRSAKIDQLKKSRKNDKGEWEKYLETGVKSYPKDIGIYTESIAPINLGIVFGKVIKQVGNKILVQDKYMSPKEKTWKTRDIPILLNDSINNNYENRYIYATCHLAGKNEKKESKVYGIAYRIYIV